LAIATDHHAPVRCLGDPLGLVSRRRGVRREAEPPGSVAEGAVEPAPRGEPGDAVHGAAAVLHRVVGADRPGNEDSAVAQREYAGEVVEVASSDRDLAEAA